MASRISDFGWYCPCVSCDVVDITDGVGDGGLRICWEGDRCRLGETVRFGDERRDRGEVRRVGECE